MISVDEASFNLAMARTHGRAPPGARVVADAPVNYGRNVTVFGALGCAGVVATLAVEGAADTLAVDTFVAEILAPLLRPGQVVLLDNLSAHKAAAVRVAVEARGARLLFLPPYSPDFAPVEKLWAKVKTLVRGAAARTREALLDALAAALDRVTARDATAWFRHCGFAQPEPKPL